MAEENKKISFGFSKINKKPALSLQKKEEKQIQFIDCLEGNDIKLINEEKKDEPLIIPLRNKNILRNNLIETLKARKQSKPIDSEKKLKEETLQDDGVSGPLTLDELAAKEILENLKKVNETDESQEDITISQEGGISVSEKESTLDDYENMPVNQFGLALLRGMGWKPGKGIGKNAQLITPNNPVVRPKGMGLGADKVITVSKIPAKEELKMVKGAFLKIISGPNKGLYGKVEGFGELPGRIIVRLTLKNIVISISENLIELVTSNEFNKSSKVLNLNEYNDFLDDKKVSNNDGKERKAQEHKIVDKHFRKNDEYASKQKEKHNQDHRGTQLKNSVSNNISTKYENRLDMSDSEKQTKYKHNSHKFSGSNHKSSKLREKTFEIHSSSSDSSIEKIKSRRKKHHKHSSRNRSRSRSQSISRKKKKKNRHRSRS